MCSDEALEEIEALTAILEETSFNNSNNYANISLVKLFYVHLDILYITKYMDLFLDMTDIKIKKSLSLRKNNQGGAEGINH